MTVPLTQDQPTLPWTIPVRRAGLNTLQINLGRYCNLACVHCHIEAGPKRTEMMSGETLSQVIAWMEQHRPPVVDITGGAPELIPGFRRLVTAARAAGCAVMDRCNLACLDEPGQEDLAEFLAENRVTVVASLPCYLQDNVDRQRGRGTFDRSTRGLQRLNQVGYARSNDLPLYLVFNPTGPSLPPRQEVLEQDYRRRLKEDWNVDFTALWCLTNVAITRYRAWLSRNGLLESYEQKLLEAFNPATLTGLMCRTTLSVDWEGRLHDCDFNLALGLHLADAPEARYLWDVEPAELKGMPIAMRSHCLACTAGCGSSCTGAVA
jgi:radical SAM/Cys-rich protein